jgi:predicted O-methyltransferase YrrM
VSHPPDLPDIVNRAFDVSRRAGYVSFCRNETGRLLAMLAATRDGTMAEFGTGCGVGTAWLRSGVRGEKARILTAELDPKLAKAAAEIFADDPLVEVLAADWSTLRDKGPYSLLFLDSGQPTEVGVDAVVDLVEGGGIVVLDDFTPC